MPSDKSIIKQTLVVGRERLECSVLQAKSGASQCVHVKRKQRNPKDRPGRIGRMGRRLFKKFVRAGRDGRPRRAAGMDF